MTQREAIKYSIALENKIEKTRKTESAFNLNKMQEESDRLWIFAKSMNAQKATKKNYEDLANAVVKQAIFDYEALISNTKTSTASCNIQEIIAFAKQTNFTSLDLYAILLKIKSDRQKKFIPYIRKNFNDIVFAYRDFKNKRVDTIAYNINFPYRCTMCGNAIKPEFRDCNNRYVLGVGCTTCRTFVYLKDI